MAWTKLKKRDLQRYRKIYPYIRRQPKYAFLSDKQAQMEVGSIPFTNASSGTYIFKEYFQSVPYISAISYDSEVNGSADVNIFVKSISTTQVVIEASQQFTGKVHFHAIWVAE
tara:strand:- start:1243 stop:1581 length:339 start_codon:yes stop_codon:yes gene_type:complete